MPRTRKHYKEDDKWRKKLSNRLWFIRANPKNNGGIAAHRPIKQKEIAKMTGLSAPIVCQYEKGTVTPSVVSISFICEVCGYTMGEFFKDM